MKQNEEMAVLKTEMKYLKNALDRIVPQIEDMHSTFLKGEGKIATNKQKIDYLIKTIDGNGHPGIKHEIITLKNKLSWYAGGIAVLVTLLPIVLHLIWR